MLGAKRHKGISQKREVELILSLTLTVDANTEERKECKDE